MFCLIQLKHDTVIVIKLEQFQFTFQISQYFHWVTGAQQQEGQNSAMN